MSANQKVRNYSIIEKNIVYINVLPLPLKCIRIQIFSSQSFIRFLVRHLRGIKKPFLLKQRLTATNDSKSKVRKYYFES